MSDIYSITRGQLEDVADAIRLKTGKSAKMTVAEMPNEIDSIEPGGGGLVYTSNCFAKSNGIVLPGVIGIASIPTPDDCPFNCNFEFLGTDSAEYIVTSSGDGSRTYQRTKYSDNKYVIVIAVQFSGYNNILYISPDSPDAVEFQADSYEPVASSTDSYVYNGTTWYFSSTGYTISGEMDIQRTTAPIYPESVTLDNNKYSDESKEAILQYVGASLKPTPNDCPFTCNLTYFMDSRKEWSIASVPYKKNDDKYAVGVCLQIAPGGEQWTAPVLVSTDIDAVKYSVNGTDYSQNFPPKSFSYDDGENIAIWYYSVCYGQYGWHTPSGIVMLNNNNNYHPTTVDAYLSDSEVQSILQLMQVKNKPIQGGGN